MIDLRFALVCCLNLGSLQTEQQHNNLIWDLFTVRIKPSAKIIFIDVNRGTISTKET